MPIIHNKDYIDYSKFGGVPDIIWCAKLILTLTIEYTNTASTLNLIQDLGIDPNINNIKAIDFGDGTGVHFITNNNINIDYTFRNNISNKYNITLYSDSDKITYYPVNKDIDDIHIKTDGIKFNYNPLEKPVMKYTKRQLVANGYRIPSIKPYKAEDIFYMYVGKDLVFGSLINVKELIMEIEITDITKPIRLINPLSNPRFSWERLKNHVEIHWGDGYITKWLDFYINSGRFNREIGYKLEHTYENCKVGDRFTIKIKSKEPLVPINCKLIGIDGEFPTDNYIVRKNKVSEEIVGLFGVCDHVDYPEISLLNTHRSTITRLGKNICNNFLNTTMERFFENFTGITRIEEEFFDRILGNVKSYNQCFKGCTSLVSKPKGLLGYVNDMVVNIDEMFMNCSKLQNSLNLRVSTSLITAKAVYRNCIALNLFEKDFLYECINLKYINDICRKCSSLINLNVDQFKLSNNLEEASAIFFDSGVVNSCKLDNKPKLWYIRNAFGFDFANKVRGNLINIPEGSFKNSFTQAVKPVDINNIFINQGGTTGLIIPTGLFEPLKNAPDITITTDRVFYLALIKGHTIPANIFKDVWNTNKPNNNYALTSCFEQIETTDGYLEIVNTQFTGDNSKLTNLSSYFSGGGRDTNLTIDYIDKDYLKYLPNLTNLSYFFSGQTINCILPEDFLVNQRKINNLSNFMYGVMYKYSHFPIDYLIHTDSNTLDLNNMFNKSNIKTYRLIHWDSSKTIDVTTTNMVTPNSQTVPLSFILDGRNNLNEEIPYGPSTIRFITLSSKNYPITLRVIGTLIEPLSVDWGDGSPVETVNTQTTTHTFNTVQNIITVTGRNAVNLASTEVSVDMQEVRGEFPYNSDFTGEWPDGRNDFYLDPIYHISKNYLTTGGKNSYLHPHYFKHATRITSIEWFNNEYLSLGTIHPKFFYHCQSLTSFKNILNINGLLMLPKNIFPDTLNYSTGYTPSFFIGNYEDDNINRNKVHIFKEILEKPYMTDTKFPFGSSYVTIPWNSTIKQFEMINEPMYEYLGFVIRSSVSNLGLERLITGDTRSIGKIKICVYTKTQCIEKEVTVNNDSELSNIIGAVTVDSGTFGVIKVYSAIPLWLNNHNIIDEIRGVIPECELNKPMSSLAPNLSYTSETIFMRLTNKSFRGMMANLPKLRFVHRNLFLCNINANDFESCFENDTGLYMVPDFIISAKDYDVNCKRMFKGCINIDYVFRPICDSVRGRIEVDEMFSGCKTVCFTDDEINSQVFNKLWYRGDSKLVLKPVSSGLRRATHDYPTTLHAEGLQDSNGVGIVTAETTKMCTYINGPTQASLINSLDENLVKYVAYKSRCTLRSDSPLNKTNKNTKDFAKMFKYLPNIITIDFGVNGWYTQDSNATEKVYQTFDPELFMYLEKLHSIHYAFSNTIVNTPIDNTFMIFNESINNIHGFLLNSGMKDKDTIDRSAILGYDHLGYAFLGGEGIRIPLELKNSFFSRNMECINDMTDAFRNLWGDFSKDTWSIGKCHPLHINGTFAVDSDKLSTKYIGVPLTDNLVKNIWNINSNPTKSAEFNAYVEFIDTFKGNPNVVNDQNFINRVLSVAAAKPNARFRSIFENTPLKVYNKDTFNNINYTNDVSFETIYKNTKIDTLPNINNIPNAISFKGMVANCPNINEEVPENYIDSHMENCDISDIFSGASLVKVNKPFIKENSNTTYDIKNSLTDVVSTIGSDSRIYKGVNYINESNAFNINTMLSVSKKDIFTEAIRVLYDNTSIYPEYFGIFTNDSEFNIMNYIIKDKLQIDWGDNSGITIHKGETITEDNLTHTYEKAGTYYIRMYLDGITMFITPTKTIEITGISEFCSDDILDIVDIMDGFELQTYFGNKLTYVADYPFKYMKNIDKLYKLSMFRDQSSLRYEPQIISEDMINLKHLDYYYMGCLGIYNFDVNIIPLNIRNNIKTAISMYSNSGVTDSTHLLDGYNNIESVNGFLEDCHDLNIFNPRILNNKPRLVECNSFIANCTKIFIDSSFNNFFYGSPNIKYLEMTFMNVPIKEFPQDIFSYLPNLLRCHKTFMTTIDLPDNDFSLSDNVFKYNKDLRDISCMFKGRISLKAYNKNIFKYNDKLYGYTLSFKNTGISHLYSDTILVGSINGETIECIDMFSNCPVKTIDNGIIKQNDTRIVNISNMLSGITGIYTEKEVIGNIKSIGRSGYEQISDKYKVFIPSTKNVRLTPVDNLIKYPININYTFTLGDEIRSVSQTVTSKENIDNLLNFETKNNVEVIKVKAINSPKLTINI